VAERITVEDLTKVYPGGNQALREVSLEVEPGTFLVLLGPSGSGKTTLLRALAGIERITSGRITIGAAVVADGRAHVPPDRRDLSMVFQDYALWPHLTVRDNVAFALRRHRLTRARSRELAGAMLERVGLAALAGRYPNELSGGEQQRVALARALVADTGLVLCDEPLSNLDADLRERMRVEISSLVREAGATTLYITHDQAEAFALADRVGVLERGRLVQTGSPEEIYTRPASPFVARFTGLSGEFPVQIRDTSMADYVEVEPAGDAGREPAGPGRQAGGRPFRARHPGGPLAAGTGLLLVRPTGVQICPADDAGHHLTGTVADVAFRGRGYDHAIDVPGQGRLTGVFSPARAGRGERVGLRFDPDGCHVFAPPEPGPAGPGGPGAPTGQAADGQGTSGPAATAAAGPRVT
jgi:ABC-type Fe3+/spermidine/putrescine transport system ATPase subunit